MSADVEVIRARADAATAGPWKRGEEPDTWCDAAADGSTIGGYTGEMVPTADVWTVGRGDDWTPEMVAQCQSYVRDAEDAAFIAAARTDVPLLCDALTDARARVAALEAEREGLRAERMWMRQCISRAPRFLPSVGDDDHYLGMHEDPDGVWINGASLAARALLADAARDAGRARGET